MPKAMPLSFRAFPLHEMQPIEPGAEPVQRISMRVSAVLAAHEICRTLPVDILSTIVSVSCGASLITLEIWPLGNLQGPKISSTGRCCIFLAWKPAGGL